MTAGREPVVIVGGGLAALSFAGTLRQGGYVGPLTIVSDEVEYAYDRPPLSKAFLKDGDANKIRLDDSRLADVSWQRGRRATAIDLERHRLALDDGGELEWGTLVLATGSHARSLPMLADLGRPIMTLRTLNDAHRLREQLKPGVRMLLVGAGVIGLELAATARALGVAVTVVEAQDRVMARSVPPTLSRHVEERHRAEGVDLRLGRMIEACESGAVRLDDGSFVDVDVAVAGIGVRPCDELARAAGLQCDDGIVVDAWGRTAIPHILAVGDVTQQPHPITGRLARIETWANAQNQAAAAARAWLDRSSPPYADAPWFWSDQYDLRLQGVGLPSGSRELLRGSKADGRFALLQFDEARLVGASCVNNAKDFAAIRKLVGRSFAIDDAVWTAMTTDLRKLG